MKSKLGYRVSALCVFAGIGISAGNAFAADPALPTAPAAQGSAAPGAEIWYGAPTAIAAGTSSALLIASILSGQGAFAAVGMPGLLLSGPIVHWANGEVQRGFAVLGFHFGFALLGGFVAAGTCSDLCAERDWLGFRRASLFALGTSVGMIVSNAIDIGVFTYKPANPSIVTSQSRFPFTMSPQLMFDRNGGGVGLAGRF